MRTLRFNTDKEAQAYFKQYAYCAECDEKNCIHRDAYRRLPEEVGGLGECPRLPEDKRKKY